MVFVSVIALALAGAYYYYLWAPQDAKLTQMQARVDTLVAQNEVAQRQVASGAAAKLRAEADQYGRMLLVMRQLVPVANEVPTLLDQISTAARQAGLDIGDVTPLGVVGGDVFDTYRYKMGVTGSYHRIGRFLSNVGSLTRIVAPMNLTLFPTVRESKANRPKESALDATFEIQTYVAKTAAPAVSAGTATRGQ